MMVADYIIVGAGTAGLVVANRLSMNAKVLIETGQNDRNDPNVTGPPKRNENADTGIDWSYKSTPQI
jgi:choline dehydrogenase